MRPGGLRLARRLAPLSSQRPQLGSQALSLRRQFPLELGQRLLAAPYQGQLRLDVSERLLHDLAPLAARVGRAETIAQKRAGLLRLEQILQLLQRQPEQVAQAQQLAQTQDVRVVVGSVLPLRVPGRSRQEAALLVVADRARAGADEPGQLAYAVALLVRGRAHGTDQP